MPLRPRPRTRTTRRVATTTEVAPAAVDDSVPPEAGPAAREGRPSCRCGHTRGHLMVSSEPVYSGWKTFWVVFMGVSAVPGVVQYRCRVCQEVFDRTEDLEARRDTL